MEDIITAVKKLGKIRNIPQFLFIDEIGVESMIKVREEVLRIKREEDSPKEIDFIINSPGGSPDQAYRIIRTLRDNFETINIIVPFWAKSAATLVSLGGSKIIMDEFGEFGPLDIQIAKERDDSPNFDRESALNDEYSLQRIENRSHQMFTRMFNHLYSTRSIPIHKSDLSKLLFEYVSRFYKPLLTQLNPYKLGEKKRKLEIGEKYAERILTTYQPTLPDFLKKRLVDYLINGCPDHGFVIDYSIIKLFMSNVIKSSEVSGEYYLALSELSGLLIVDESDTTFVGVIQGYSEEETDIQNIQLPEEFNHVAENNQQNA